MHSNDNQNLIDFIGLGGPKTGSTWLARCLAEHPDVLSSWKKFSPTDGVSTGKELNFFCEKLPVGRSNYYKGLEWYLKQFPPKKEGKIRGEFSVSYLADELAPQRIKAFNPNIKLLVCFRDPTEVVYSFYKMISVSVRPDNPKNLSEMIEQKFLFEYALYGQQLARYYEYFDKSQIFYVFNEDIKTKPKEILKEVFKFLNIRSDFLPPSYNQRINRSKTVKNLKIHNLVKKVAGIFKQIGGNKFLQFLHEQEYLYDFYRRINIIDAKTLSYKGELDLESRKKILAFYIEDIEKLEKLVNRDLTTWKTL